ncbi:MAG: 2,3-bisphosphoglycerate-independent phosphoglycerate mutase [Alphaproteobacteria bacterium]
MKRQNRPVVLCVLDGWGHAPPGPDNAIDQAETPTWDRLIESSPHALLGASSAEVGLPEGQMGNSEVGHVSIGAGRLVLQDLPRIDAAIADGSLAKSPALADFIARVKEQGGTCHLLGLMSPGGVHAHQGHIATLARLLAEAGLGVAVHAMLDGRDTPPASALDYVKRFEAELSATLTVRIATLGGRYYAMDRDRRWERTALAYDNLVSATGARAHGAVAAIETSYAAGVTDEFVKPVAIGAYRGMADGDGLLVANFRADRVRQILSALLDPAFDAFAREKTLAFTAALGMIEYGVELKAHLEALFPPERLSGLLGAIVAEAGLKQLRIAETEKYAHVTYFLNGGEERFFEGEEHIFVPSPKVATYDLAPAMSAAEVTDKVVGAIEGGRFDLIVVNYANADMVGHTGDFDAAVAAVEVIDRCLARLLGAVETAGGALLITADHGNIECMRMPGAESPHTAHTANPVPVLLVGGGSVGLRDGRLADIAPTVLYLLGLAPSDEMTGRSLITGTARNRPEKSHAALA